MFQQYSHYPENASDPPYAESSISGTSVLYVDYPIPQAPATAHLPPSRKSSRNTSPCPIPGQPSPSRPSPYASSTPSLSRSESRPKSLGNGYVASRGPSSFSEKGSRHDHSHPPDALNPPHAKDPEKGSMGYAGSSSRDSQQRRTTYIYPTDEMDRQNSCAEEHAVWILVSASLSSFRSATLTDGTRCHRYTSRSSRPL